MEALAAAVVMVTMTKIQATAAVVAVTEGVGEAVRRRVALLTVVPAAVDLENLAALSRAAAHLP